MILTRLGVNGRFLPSLRDPNHVSGRQRRPAVIRLWVGARKPQCSVPERSGFGEPGIVELPERRGHKRPGARLSSI